MNRKPYKIQCRCRLFYEWPWRTWKRYVTLAQAEQAMAALSDDVFEFRLVDETQNTKTSTGKTPPDTLQSSQA